MPSPLLQVSRHTQRRLAREYMGSKVHTRDCVCVRLCVRARDCVCVCVHARLCVCARAFVGVRASVCVCT